MIIRFVVFVFLITGCGIVPKEQISSKPITYSSDTETEFSSIENLDSPYSDDTRNAALRYQKLREESWQNYLKKRPQKQRMVPLKRRNQQRQSYTPKVKTIDPQEEKNLQIQSQQMMNYFCMKNRSNGKYRNTDFCQEYTKNTLQLCKDRNRGQISKSVVRCLKSRLKV